MRTLGEHAHWYDAEARYPTAAEIQTVFLRERRMASSAVISELTLVLLVLLVLQNRKVVIIVSNRSSKDLDR